MKHRVGIWFLCALGGRFGEAPIGRTTLKNPNHRSQDGGGPQSAAGHPEGVFSKWGGDV